MTNDDYLTLSQIDALIEQPRIRVPFVTYVGVQVFAGLAMLLVNDATGSTKTLVHYDSDEPVVIRERQQPKRSTWTRMVMP